MVTLTIHGDDDTKNVAVLGQIKDGGFSSNYIGLHLGRDDITIFLHTREEVIQVLHDLEHECGLLGTRLEKRGND